MKPYCVVQLSILTLSLFRRENAAAWMESAGIGYVEEIQDLLNILQSNSGLTYCIFHLAWGMAVIELCKKTKDQLACLLLSPLSSVSFSLSLCHRHCHHCYAISKVKG